MISSTGKPLPAGVQDKLSAIAKMTPGDRFEVLTELAALGFVINVRLRPMWDGTVFETVAIETVEEWERSNKS